MSKYCVSKYRESGVRVCVSKYRVSKYRESGVRVCVEVPCVEVPCVIKPCLCEHNKRDYFFPCFIARHFFSRMYVCVSVSICLSVCVCELINNKNKITIRLLCITTQTYDWVTRMPRKTSIRRCHTQFSNHTESTAI